MQTSTITLEKKSWRLLKNLNIGLPYDPAILLLGIYPKECDTGYSRGTCTPMFIGALFTIAKLWRNNQDAQLLMNGLRKCGMYVYTMEFFSAMKMNEILSFKRKWMKLENIILSEVSQAQKTKNPNADFRSRAKTARELDFGHMSKARAHKGGMRIRKKPKKS
jgi:hypothetical protein